MYLIIQNISYLSFSTTITMESNPGIVCVDGMLIKWDPSEGCVEDSSDIWCKMARTWCAMCSGTSSSCTICAATACSSSVTCPDCPSPSCPSEACGAGMSRDAPQRHVADADRLPQEWHKIEPPSKTYFKFTRWWIEVTLTLQNCIIAFLTILKKDFLIRQFQNIYLANTKSLLAFPRCTFLYRTYKTWKVIYPLAKGFRN